MIAAYDESGLRRPACTWRPLLIIGLVYTVGMSGYLVWRADKSTDFRDYWENALHFRETGEISSTLGVHNYLPVFTLLMSPWSLMPLQVAIVVFTWLSMALFALTLYLIETMLSGRPPPGPRWSTLALLGLLAPYITSCVVLGAVELLLLFLVVAAWFLVEQRREYEAGFLIALAALIKLLPAGLLVLFVLRGRWRVVGSAAVTAIVIGALVPWITLGTERFVSSHRAFYESAAGEHGALHTLTAEQPHKAKYTNVALPLVVRRLLSPLNASGSDEWRLRVNLLSAPTAAIVGVYCTLVAALLASTILVTRWRAAPWPSDEEDDDRAASARAALRAQYGAWCCLIVLLSPLVWTRYVLLAAWALAVVADHGERFDVLYRRPCRVCLIGLLGWLLGAIGLALPAARAVGGPLLGVLAVWLSVSVLAERWRRAARTNSSTRR